MSTLSPLICIAVLGLLVKRVDPRLCLLLGGFALFTVQGNPLATFDSFARAMTNAPMIEAVCSSMGFAAVLKTTGSDAALVERLAAPIRKGGILLPIAATVIAFIVNIALPSGAGAAAAVATTLIPLLLRAGVSPQACAASILLGTFGSMLSPGLAHNAIVAQIAGATIRQVIAFHFAGTLLALVVVIVVFEITAALQGDLRQCGNRGDTSGVAERPADTRRQNWKAVTPMIPPALLFLSMAAPKLLPISIGGAMLAGGVFAALVSPNRCTQIVRAFFTGMGQGFANVLGITISATVFADGLVEIDGFRSALQTFAEGECMLPASGLMAFGFSAVSGSSDAITYALNQLVTAQPSLSPSVQLAAGTFVTQSAQLGRLLSPYSGAAMLLSELCGIRSSSILRLTSAPLLSAFVLLLLLRNFG